MQSKNIIIAFFFTTVLMFASVWGVAHEFESQVKDAVTQSSPSRLGDVGQPIYTGVPSNTGVLCTTASTTVIAATSTSRRYLEVRNMSNNTIFLSLGTYAATSTGVAISASSSPFIISPYTFMYSGAIYCTATTNSSSTVLQAS